MSFHVSLSACDYLFFLKPTLLKRTAARLSGGMPHVVFNDSVYRNVEGGKCNLSGLSPTATPSSRLIITYCESSNCKSVYVFLAVAVMMPAVPPAAAPAVGPRVSADGPTSGTGVAENRLM